MKNKNSLKAFSKLSVLSENRLKIKTFRTVRLVNLFLSLESLFTINNFKKSLLVNVICHSKY